MGVSGSKRWPTSYARSRSRSTNDTSEMNSHIEKGQCNRVEGVSGSVSPSRRYAVDVFYIDHLQIDANGQWNHGFDVPYDWGRADWHIRIHPGSGRNVSHWEFYQPQSWPNIKWNVLWERRRRLAEDRGTDLGHDHDLFAWEVELLDRLSQYNLRLSVRISVRSIEALNSHIIAWDWGLTRSTTKRWSVDGPTLLWCAWELPPQAAPILAILYCRKTYIREWF